MTARILMTLRCIGILLSLSLALLTVRPALAQSPGSTMLLSTSGVGEAVTDLFRSTTGHVSICYSTAGRSPGGYSGPFVIFDVETDGPLITSDFAEQRCVDKYVRPALYWVHVNATDWSAWDLNIYDLPLQLAPPPVPQSNTPSFTSLPAQVAAPQPVAIASPDPSGTVLSQFSGSGDRQSPSFSITTSQVQICWNVSGRSPTFGVPPSVGLFIQSDTLLDSANFQVGAEEQNCSYAHLKPGTYYLKVIATPWSNYSITVTAV